MSNYKHRWQHMYSHLPHPSTLKQKTLTPQEVAALAGVKATTVTGGYMNRPVSALKPDAYSEDADRTQNQVYFTEATVQQFLAKKKVRETNARKAFQNDEGYRKNGIYA